MMNREIILPSWCSDADLMVRSAQNPEIPSSTDSLEKLKQKMQEYIDSAVRLGWLIDRKNQQALVYRSDGTVTQYPAGATLNGEDVAPGFILPLSRVI